MFWTLSPTLSYRHVWQAQAVYQAREPRLTAQTVEFGIADRDDPHHALRERLFKLIQRRFVVSDTGERDGQVVRRDVITSGTLDQARSGSSARHADRRPALARNSVRLPTSMLGPRARPHVLTPRPRASPGSKTDMRARVASVPTAHAARARPTDVLPDVPGRTDAPLNRFAAITH